MIGKVIMGKSFGPCIAYCLQDKGILSKDQKVQLTLQDGLQHEGRAEVLDYNLCFGDKKELAIQFQDVQKLNRRVEKPVLHLTFRLGPGDVLTREQWVEIGREAAREFGIDKNQYVCILHKDTAQRHIHIVANRVGFDGKVASDSQNYARMAALCRRLEKQFNLKQVLSPRRFLSPKDKQIRRQDSRKERLRAKITEVLKTARTFAEFEKAMQASGYRIDKGRGIAFEDDKKVRIKGSDVGFSLTTIKRILSQNQRPVFLKPSYPQHPENSVGRTYDHPAASSPTLGPSNGLSWLVWQLLKPETSSGLSNGPDEEQRKKKRKRKPPHF